LSALHPHWNADVIVALILVPVFAWVAVEAWRSGRIGEEGTEYSRSEQPLAFWSAFALNAFLLIGVAGFALWSFLWGE
jgi:hypothetical protein